MIELKNICKSYGDPPVAVLDNVNLKFPEGITCIMGPSGVGKTTLIYTVAGLVVADSGKIVGRDGKKLSIVFQEDRLLDWESAITNVLFVSKSSRADFDRAKLLLERSGLADSIYKKASELSGGMRRRVCICRALIADYDLLILDEPFKGLDNEMRLEVMEMVKEYSRGKIVICVTHDLDEVEFLGGSLVELK